MYIFVYLGYWFESERCELLLYEQKHSFVSSHPLVHYPFLLSSDEKQIGKRLTCQGIKKVYLREVVDEQVEVSILRQAS